jgi:hypothetical protein
MYEPSGFTHRSTIRRNMAINANDAKLTSTDRTSKGDARTLSLACVRALRGKKRIPRWRDPTPALPNPLPKSSHERSFRPPHRRVTILVNQSFCGAVSCVGASFIDSKSICHFPGTDRRPSVTSGDFAGEYHPHSRSRTSPGPQLCSWRASVTNGIGAHPVPHVRSGDCTSWAGSQARSRAR